MDTQRLIYVCVYIHIGQCVAYSIRHKYKKTVANTRGNMWANAGEVVSESTKVDMLFAISAII